MADPLPPPPTNLPRRPDVAPRSKTPWSVIGVVLAAYLIQLGVGAFVFIRALDAFERVETRESGDPVPDTFICRTADRLLDRAEASPQPGPARIADLSEVAQLDIGPSFVYEGDVPIPDAATIGVDRGPVWEAELERDGFRHGIVRAWELPTDTSASVWIYEFETVQGAFDMQRFGTLEQSCPYSYDVFEVEGVEGGVGLQISWADGTESEQVSFVRGTRRYLANVRGPQIPERRLILTLARALDETAR